MRRCPYCGEKIRVDVQECGHCGKALRKSKSESDGSTGLTNANSWQGKSVPAWVMYAVVIGLMFYVWLMILKGCDRNNPRPPIQTDSETFPQENGESN